MTSDEILRKEPSNYTGNVPQRFVSMTESPENNFEHLNSAFQILHKIPPKITAFFHRTKIKSVFKVDKRTYYILAVDDTVFAINY